MRRLLIGAKSDKTSRRIRRNAKHSTKLNRRSLPDANLSSLCASYNSAHSACKESFCFPKRIKLVRQIAERHTDDGDDDIGNSRPPLEHLDEEFQAEVVDEDIADSNEKIPNNLRSAT